MQKKDIPLCVAAANGELVRVVELLEQGADPNQRTDATPGLEWAEPAGRTALHHATL